LSPGTVSGAARARGLEATDDMADAPDSSDSRLSNSRPGRSRISKPGVREVESSFFDKNKILVIVGLILLALALAGGIIGALFAFHIISFNVPH
jgi:hypothetical protein